MSTELLNLLDDAMRDGYPLKRNDAYKTLKLRLMEMRPDRDTLAAAQLYEAIGRELARLLKEGASILITGPLAAQPESAPVAPAADVPAVKESLTTAAEVQTVGWLNARGEFLLHHPESYGRADEEWWPLGHIDAQQATTSQPAEPAADAPKSKAERVHAQVNAGRFPGMSEAFDAHMGAACWTDPAYAQDASMWAAAWKAAQSAAPRLGPEEERAHFSEWIETADPFDRNTGMVEHSIKTTAAEVQPVTDGPVLHAPSGFAFDSVIAAVDPGSLIPLTPEEQPTSQPAPTAAEVQPVGHVRIDSGEVHFVPKVRDAEASPLTDGQKLYAAPGSNAELAAMSAADARERVPLTREQVMQIWREVEFSPDWICRFASGIERAHNIGTMAAESKA